MSYQDILIVTGCMGSLGLFGFIVGLLAYFGIYKSLYAMKGNPALAPNSLAYIALPGSILPFLFALLPLFTSPEKANKFFLYIICPYQIFLIALAIWQPEWLKPKWLRWLEKEHGHILELLWDDVRKNRWEWEFRIRTQSDLENWVSDVRSRKGL